MMRLSRLTSALTMLLLAGLVWLSCSDDDKSTDPNNNPPVILSMTADPDTIYEDGEITTVTVTAEDPDDDPLTYKWLAQHLEPPEEDPDTATNTVRLRACCDITEPTTDVVRTTVEDGRGGEAHGSVDIVILPREE